MTVFTNLQETLDRDLNYQYYYKRCERLLVQFQHCIETSPHVTFKEKKSHLLLHAINQQEMALDICDFNHVLSIDETEGCIEVEAFTTYDALVQISLKWQLLPTIVPAFKFITVGAALSGISIASSSFYYGLMQETVVEFDVLTGDGDIITCRADNEYSDLFFAFPNSYGSLGYALRVVLKLVPVTSFVELTHQHFHQPKSFFDQLEKCCINNQAIHAEQIHFVEGVIFNRYDLVLSTGKLVEYAPYLHDYKYMQMYYQSLQNRQKDYLPISDYTWRWDTDWFWYSRLFGMQHFLVRLFLGKFCLRSACYRKLFRMMHRFRLLRWMMQKHMASTESININNVVIPIECAYDFFQFFIDTIPLRPFWICPIIHANDTRYMLFPLTSGKLYVNFGFWGMVASTEASSYYSRLIREKVIALDGFQLPYAHAYDSEESFWQFFDKQAYLTVKQQYDKVGRLAELYQKNKVC